jgi:hypothetical protein
MAGLDPAIQKKGWITGSSPVMTNGDASVKNRHILEHDVFRLKQIMLLSYCYRMLFCEKPLTLFHSML